MPNFQNFNIPKLFRIYLVFQQVVFIGRIKKILTSAFFISLFVTSFVCNPATAQPTKQIVTLKSLKCDGYDCYFEFLDPKTKKLIPVKGINLDKKYEKNWKAAWDEVLEKDSEQEGTDWLVNKKYAISLVYRFGESSHLDENGELVVVRTKTKEWFVTSLKRLP